MSSKRLQRIAASILLVILAILSCGGQLDTMAENRIERSLTRALSAFAVARGLNGVLSVAQGTEFTLQPAGFGIIFPPGEILDPLNDLIEEFSVLMLVASTSLGVQRIILAVAKWPYFSFAVSFLLILAVTRIWQAPYVQKVSARPLYKLAFIFIVLRFGIIVFTVGSEAVFVTFLSSEYETASAQLNLSTDKIGQLNTFGGNANSKEDSSSFREWASQIYNSASSTFNISARIEQYQLAAAEVSRSAIELVVVFVVQTLLLPLLFFSILKSCVRSLLQLRFSGQ